MPKPSYTGIALLSITSLGITPMIGCGEKQPDKIAPDPVNSNKSIGSFLEQTVHAQETPELDLSTPERGFAAYISAYNDQDFDMLERLISSENTSYHTTLNKERKEGQLSRHKKISNVLIPKKEEIDNRKVTLYMIGTVEGKKKESKVTMIYEANTWKFLSSSR
jgi:predicted lipid-binding transport protein (Tim44 family)